VRRATRLSSRARRCPVRPARDPHTGRVRLVPSRPVVDAPPALGAGDNVRASRRQSDPRGRSGCRNRVHCTLYASPDSGVQGATSTPTQGRASTSDWARPGRNAMLGGLADGNCWAEGAGSRRRTRPCSPRSSKSIDRLSCGYDLAGIPASSRVMTPSMVGAAISVVSQCVRAHPRAVDSSRPRPAQRRTHPAFAAPVDYGDERLRELRLVHVSTVRVVAKSNRCSAASNAARGARALFFCASTRIETAITMSFDGVAEPNIALDERAGYT